MKYWKNIIKVIKLMKIRWYRLNYKRGKKSAPRINTKWKPMYGRFKGKLGNRWKHQVRIEISK